MDAPLSTAPCVLLVDEDVRALRVLSQLLRDDGFEVEVAADGARAIARLSREPVPDAIVTDYTTPLVSGSAVTEYARARRPRLPVFFLTGHPHLAGKTTSDPAPIVLAKPLDYGRLLAELRRVLPTGP